MDCPSCQTPNFETEHHCQRCGALLPVSDHLPSGAILGSVTIEQVLGRGGFGITYLGRLENGTPAAIKEFFPEDTVQRLHGGMVVALPTQKPEFERLLVRAQFEAETLQLLKHESATKFYGAWQQNGTMYMAMEFIQGQSLQSRIESGVKLREIEARAVLMACLGVLQELHGLGLLHRDIKPANIMLGASRVELIDYGSAVKFKIGERIKRERLLTPMYAPLEQFGEEVQLTPATDFYALAATLYHALTQVAPPNALERARGTVLKPIRDLEPSISVSLARVIDESLTLELNKRPISAENIFGFLQGSSQLKASLHRKEPLTIEQQLLWKQKLQNQNEANRLFLGCGTPFYLVFLWHLIWVIFVDQKQFGTLFFSFTPAIAFLLTGLIPKYDKGERDKLKDKT